MRARTDTREPAADAVYSAELRQADPARVQGRVAAFVLAATLLGMALFMLPDFEAPGAALDEGFLLAYPDRILEGDLPHRDFETFYGPGDFYVLAGIFAVLEPTPDVERAVGLAYRLMIVAALFFILLPWRLPVATAGAVLAGIVLASTELPASAAIGGLALALIGLALGLQAAARPPDRAGRALPLLAGVALGMALFFRFDQVLPIALAAAPIAIALPGRARRFLAAGFVLGLAPYVPHLVLVGTDGVEHIASDIGPALRGRRLPLSSMYPDLLTLYVAQLACAVSTLLVGVSGLRRFPGSPRYRSLTVGGLLAIGLQPYVLGRPDAIHVLTAAVIALSFVPPLALLVVRRLAPDSGSAALVAPLAAAGVAAALLAPSIVRGHALTHLKDLVGASDPIRSVEVGRAGRSFPLSAAARPNAVAALLGDVERSSDPGDSLIVAPRDLRRTNYNDTFLYYLFPELEPGTYYMEMAPGTATRPGSGFVNELRAADLLVLNRRWDDWDEPNSSSDLGPATPNKVVDQGFCRVSKRGPYELFRRCPASDTSR